MYKHIKWVGQRQSKRWHINRQHMTRHQEGKLKIQTLWRISKLIFLGMVFLMHCSKRIWQWRLPNQPQPQFIFSYPLLTPANRKPLNFCQQDFKEYWPPNPENLRTRKQPNMTMTLNGRVTVWFGVVWEYLETKLQKYNMAQFLLQSEPNNC